MTIVKVQLPIDSIGVFDGPALVYPKERRPISFVPVTLELQTMMAGRLKAFFHAERDGDGWRFGERAPEQEW